jgi:chemotaxis protein CheX
MNTDISLLTRSREENWLPILELAVEEVFEIMLGCRVRPGTKTDGLVSGGCTAMVGLAGSLCGILTFSCDAKTSRELAKCMLGPEVANSDNEVSDALGEICNMVAGNFKNKLSHADGACMLSVPTVIKGDEYSLRSLADGMNLKTTMLFSDSSVTVCLQLHN